MAVPHFKSPLNIRLGPSGAHLFNRETGLNVLLDEFRPSPDTWANAPRHVSVALTNACDLACRHCYAPKNPASLPFETLTRWLDELSANGCLGIGFGGGEPTLYHHLADVCRYATENTRLAVSLTTHAHHLSESLLKSLEASLHFVRVSMDGTGKTYERLRDRPFDDLLRRLEALRNRIPFGINYVVSAATLPDLNSAIAVAAEYGAVQFLLLPLQPVKGHAGIDEDTALALRNWIIRYRGEVPLAISQEGAEGVPTCDPLPEESGLGAFAHIDASGVLKRLSFARDGITIGRAGVMAALIELNLESEEEIG